MHKKGLKFAPVIELGKLNFTYITKRAKARPGFDDQTEYPSVQINFSSPCQIQSKETVRQTRTCKTEKKPFYNRKFISC